jgi:hypothetical protein
MKQVNLLIIRTMFAVAVFTTASAAFAGPPSFPKGEPTKGCHATVARPANGPQVWR